MATTYGVPMSDEPSRPEEREEQHLETKSYANAAEQKTEPHEGMSPNEYSGNEEQAQLAPIVKVPLKEVASPTKERKERSKPDGEEGKKHLDSLDGKDGSETSTAAKPDGDMGKKHLDSHDEQRLSETSTAVGSEKSAGGEPRKSKKERRKEKKEAEKINGVKKEENIVYEDFEQPNGNKLTTVKRTEVEYEVGVKQGEKEARKTGHEEKDNLVSGRQAGAGWDRSGIRWAPLNVPLKRRLQTLTVLTHTLSVVLSASLFFFLCAIPLLWPLLLPYLLYCLFSSAATSGTLSHRSPLLRSLPIWSLFASYFPARLHRTAELPPTRKYIFGYHPHGILSFGAFASFATEALGFSQLFPGITNTLLTLDSNFRIPVYRDYALAMGLASVSRESCENLLSKGGPNKEGMGRAITIVIGGAQESLDAQPGSLRLVLKRRKGFVKIAIRTGADLVPVLAFGENELYDQVEPEGHPALRRVQLYVKKALGFTIPLFHARGVFNYDVGMMPYRKPLNVVVGRPVKVTQQKKPDEAYVEEVHAKYIEELERLWTDWKDVFARERRGELVIAE